MIKSDNPIQEASEDRLNREDPASRFVDHVLSLDDSEGLVVGVLGPWGTGKSSFLNLTRPHFKAADAVVIDFNPWMFSGADQLVTSFFAELSEQLKVRSGLADIGEAIGEYGGALEGLGWLPILGPWIERGRGLSKLISAASKKNAGSVDARRNKIIAKLKSAPSPIIVILDDIDRLSTQEIRDLFKLVRLTASFPKITYLVSFDRQRVELALSEGPVHGRDYLEKILQVAVDLPVIQQQTLRIETLTLLEEATSGVDWVDEEDQAAWLDAFADLVAPLIRHMRDVRRYTLAVSGSLRPFRGRIAVSDLLALEAVRTFMPDVFACLPAAASALTSVSGSVLGLQSDEGKAQIDTLLAAAGDRRDIAESMIRRLFPAGLRHISNVHYDSASSQVWRKHKRVAHKDHLSFYLEHLEGDALLAFNHAETAANLMTNEQEFSRYMDALTPQIRLEVLAGLLDQSESFSAQHVEASVPYLLNTLRTLPTSRPGVFPTSSEFFVDLLVTRLLETIEDPADLEQAVVDLLPKVDWHGGRYLLLVIVSRTPRDSESMLSAKAAAPIQHGWLQQIRTDDPAVLATEPRLLRTIGAARYDVEGKVEWEIPWHPDLTLALLKGGVVEGTEETDGSRATKKIRRLRGDDLRRLFGTDESLAERVDSVRDTLAIQDPDLLDLFDRHRDGDDDGVDF